MQTSLESGIDKLLELCELQGFLATLNNSTNKYTHVRESWETFCWPVNLLKYLLSRFPH